MKLTFVGTSHGFPEPNRKCSCIMVTVGQNIYFVDMGTPAIDAMIQRGLAPEAVKGIFVTHMHGDHTNGLPSFVDLAAWRYREIRTEICLPNVKAGELIEAWIRCNLVKNPIPVRYTQVVPGEIYNDGIVKVTAIPTQHCLDSFAFLLEAEGKSVLFTGDMKRPEIDFPYVDGGLDLLVAECAHFPASQYVKVLKKQQTKRLCLTHYYPKRYGTSIYELLTELADKAFLATDGLEVIV